MPKISIIDIKIRNIISKAGFSQPVSEYRFHPKRMWKFDYCYPDSKVAIEYEGGIFDNGRHSRAKGFTNDAEKYNQATIMGWKVLRYTVLNIHQIPEDLRAMIELIKAQEKVSTNV